MKTAIFNPKKRVFLAINNREYSLVRKVRKAPAPYVFTSTARARKFIQQNEMEGYICAAPDSFKQKRPRQDLVRNYTCAGRKSR